MKPSLLRCVSHGSEVFISSRAAAGSRGSYSSSACGSTDLFLNYSCYLQKKMFHQASAVVKRGLLSVQGQAAGPCMLSFTPKKLCTPVWQPGKPRAFKMRARMGVPWSGALWLTTQCTFYNPFTLYCTHNFLAKLNVGWPLLLYFDHSRRNQSRQVLKHSLLKLSWVMDPLME